jgi:hypothetical protein
MSAGILLSFLKKISKNYMKNSKNEKFPPSLDTLNVSSVKAFCGDTTMQKENI